MYQLVQNLPAAGPSEFISRWMGVRWGAATSDVKQGYSLKMEEM
jgi:hypothetical protein